MFFMFFTWLCFFAPSLSALQSWEGVRLSHFETHDYQVHFGSHEKYHAHHDCFGNFKAVIASTVGIKSSHGFCLISLSALQSWEIQRYQPVGSCLTHVQGTKLHHQFGNLQFVNKEFLLHFPLPSLSALQSWETLWHPDCHSYFTRTLSNKHQSFRVDSQSNNIEASSYVFSIDQAIIQDKSGSDKAVASLSSISKTDCYTSISVLQPFDRHQHQAQQAVKYQDSFD